MCDVQNKFTENSLNKIKIKLNTKPYAYTNIVQKYPEIKNHSQSCLSIEAISYAYFKYCQNASTMLGKSLTGKTKRVNL